MVLLRGGQDEFQGAPAFLIVGRIQEGAYTRLLIVSEKNFKRAHACLVFDCETRKISAPSWLFYCEASKISRAPIWFLIVGEKNVKRAPIRGF